MNLFLEQLVRKTGIFLIALLAIFILLGVAVIIGMRSEVGLIIDHLFAGTIKLIEIVELLAKTWSRFLQLLKDLLVLISPAIAGVTGLIGYVILLTLYKYVGTQGSVTLLTVGLTALLSLLPLIVWQPHLHKDSFHAQTFWVEWRSKMSLYLLNAYEIMLFVFFLTLDWREPFFLPKSLWGHVEATLGGVDLMIRGFNFHETFIFTLWLAGIAVLLAVLRQIFRIVLRALRMQKVLNGRGAAAHLESFRDRLKISLNESSDEIVQFVGYTTLVLLVFFMFPRLKLLSLVVFSATTLLWDIFHPDRFFIERKNKDLLTLAAEKILNRK